MLIDLNSLVVSAVHLATTNAGSPTETALRLADRRTRFQLELGCGTKGKTMLHNLMAEGMDTLSASYRPLYDDLYPICSALIMRQSHDSIHF